MHFAINCNVSFPFISYADWVFPLKFPSRKRRHTTSKLQVLDNKWASRVKFPSCLLSCAWKIVLFALKDSIKFILLPPKRSAAKLFRSCVCTALLQLHVALDSSNFLAHYSNLGLVLWETPKEIKRCDDDKGDKFHSARASVMWVCELSHVWSIITWDERVLKMALHLKLNFWWFI